MRDYGKVFSRIWESEDFRSLTEDGRALVMYLLTCQHGTIAGVFRLPDGYACEDLQWDAERVAKGFRDLESKGFATRCERTKWVWIFKYLAWNPPENPNQAKAVTKCAAQVPDGCSWKARFSQVNGGSQEIPSAPPKDNPSGTLTQPFLNQEQEQEQEKEKAPRAAPSALTVVDLKAEGVSEDAANAFLAIRRRKRAPLSPVAWAGFKREASKAGWGLDAAVRKAAERGWQSFEADWVKSEPVADVWAGAR